MAEMIFASAAPIKTVREPTNLLHIDDREFILFSFWKSGTIVGLIGSMLIIMIIGVLYEAMSAFRIFMTKNNDSIFNGSSDEDSCPGFRHDNNSDTTMGVIKVAFKSITKQRLILSGLYAAELTVLCILILLVVSFNIWIILSVIVGRAVGHFFFTGSSAIVNRPVQSQIPNISMTYSSVSSRHQ